MGYYLVWGLGISGLGAISLLLTKNQKIKVWDDDKKKLLDFQEKHLLPNCLILTKLDKKSLADVDCIVLSPTVRIDKKTEKLTQDLGIKIMGEFSFASNFNKAPIFAVTGTNGKTTTVNMLHSIFTHAGLGAHLVGNVGTPLSSVVNEINPEDKVVAELSSFQLENIEGVSASAVAITNIAPDHMNMYSRFDDYVSAKRNILTTVQSKKVFLNYDDPILQKWGDDRSKYFSLTPLPQNMDGMYVSKGWIYSVQSGKHDPIMPAPNLGGEHNLSNFLCAACLAYSAGVSFKKIADSIPHLVIPRHRQEVVRILNGVSYVNDSKATNIHAVKSALLNNKNKRIVLLLGGSDKGENWGEFLSNLPANVICVITFGELHKALGKILKKLGKPHFDCADVYEAVYKGKSVANLGDVVLFSPGGASFDEFSSFEERGDYFCELVNEL